MFGDKGGLEWHQEEPNSLLYRPLGGFAQVLTRGRPGSPPEAERATRIVLGHPEGFHEAFANLYADAAEAIVARRTGAEPDPLALDFPTVEDGARGIKFVEAAVASHATVAAGQRPCWRFPELDLDGRHTRAHRSARGRAP